MKYNELIKGSIYYCNYPNDTSPSHRYIMKKEKGEANCSLIDVGHMQYHHLGGCFYTTNCNYRVATIEEQAHFLQCEKAGKYLEYIPINFVPLIFN